MKNRQNWLVVGGAFLDNWNSSGPTTVKIPDGSTFYLERTVAYDHIADFEAEARNLREKLGLAIELLETKEDGSQVYKVYDPDST